MRGAAPVASELARRLTQRMVVLIGVLFLIGTLVAFFQMRERAVASSLERLATHSREIAAEQERRFTAIADIEQRAVAVQRQQLASGAFDAAAFDRLFPRRSDGSRRSAPALYTGTVLGDGTRLAGVGAFVGDGETLTQDRRRLLITALTTLQRITPGMPREIDNLYFFTPGNDIVIHAPQRRDRLLLYRETAPADFDFQSEAPARAVDPRQNPQRRFQCTALAPILSDTSRRTWTTGCMMPVDIAGRHVGAWGMSLLVDRLFEPAGPYRLPGAGLALVSNDGRLIYHPAIAGSRAADLDRTLDLTRTQRPEFADLWRIVRQARGGGSDTGYSNGIGGYYAVAPIATPGWQVVAWYPRQFVDGEAWQAASTLALIAIACCLGMVLLMRPMLRDEVAEPLSRLRARAEALIAVPGGAAADAATPDQRGEVEALHDAFDVMEVAVRAERTRLTRSFEILARNVTSVAIIVLDAEARVAEWNAGAERLTGHAAADIIGQSATILRGDDAEAAATLARARAGQSARCEGWRQRVDGSRYWAVEILEPLRAPAAGAEATNDGATRIIGFGLLLRDETERREDELRLRETLRLLTLAEETARIGHWRLDLRSGAVEWSDRAAALVALGPALDPPDGLASIVASFIAEDQPALRACLADAITNAGAFAFAARSLRGGEVRNIELRGHGETDADGAPIALFGIVRDTTESLAARAELVAARDAAEAAARAHADLLATVSHEIRTPMTGILGLAELGNAGDDVLGTIRGSARMLMTILDDVLDHSTLEAGRLVLEEVPVDLAAMVRNTLALFQTSARRAGLELITDIDDGGPVIADGTRLQQILSNLVSNALKFTEAGSITVRLRRAPGHVHLTVADTGMGIDPAVAARLFDAFAQADSSMRRRFGGTGLGLSICKRLAEAMGGSIAVESAPGEGSRFQVVLPLADAPAMPVAVAGVEAPLRTASGGAPSLLVVDDTGVTRELVRAYATSLGCEVTTAGDGIEALVQATARRFDLVLLDWQLPGMSGGDIARLLRGLPGSAGRTPIIAFTASVHIRDPEVTGLTDGALPKPFTLDMLRRAIASGLELPRPAPTAAADPLAGLPGALAARLVQAFRNDATRLGDGFASAMAGNDTAAARAAAHALIGAAASIGANRLAALARFAVGVLDLVEAQRADWLVPLLADAITAAQAGVGATAGESGGDSGGSDDKSGASAGAGANRLASAAKAFIPET